MNFNHIFFLSVLIITFCSSIGSGTPLYTQETSSSQDQSIKLFLIADGDEGKTGKKIGCGDSLVAITKTIQKTNSPLKIAIQELLAIPADYKEKQELHNYWKGNDLKVKSVNIKNGMAIIHIVGELVVAGVCDEPRIQSQIEETARQFPAVKQLKVFVNNVPLAKAIR